MHEVDLLAYLASWSERNAALAEGKGVTLRFSQSPPGRAKPSAWVTATTSAAEAQLIVWASGELEFAAGSAGSVAANEHHEIGTTDELETLLTRLLAHVGAA